MTHEPECQSFDGGHTCICDVIQPAYQRGREDAAVSVQYWLEETMWLRHGKLNNPYEGAIAAARGESEKA